MTLKKKISYGVMSAALGLSLVGGGTWAAFNDVEAMSNSMEAGVLDLKVDPTVVFDVSKLVPGDTMHRLFKVENVGNLDINQVLMHTELIVTDKDGNPSKKDFGSQFKVQWLTSDFQPIITPFHKATLADLEQLTKKGESPDITTYIKELLGHQFKSDLPVNDTDHIIMSVEFLDKKQKDSQTGLYKQNKFQGHGMKVIFNLEATQYKGESREND
ncbi:cell division protein FtsN [Rossellomorea vietnamensis]|uniref:Cell division protein FtsN n=1 Tax=Rossellomorea vietnamensis TaxID=218284 RepID=A0A5D4KD06_9BACI|nr:TasA family protein [Rossellomorea vietnamensis]TYR75251.1 cell division protein FtsN [Rossellomorea vietnamensis]